MEMTFPLVDSTVTDVATGVTRRTATVWIDFVPRTIDETAIADFDAMIAAANDPNTTKAQMLALISPEQAVAHAVRQYGDITVVDGVVIVNGVVINNVLTDKLVALVNGAGDPGSFLKFANKVFSNPYDWAVDELYLWLQAGNLPITEDGNILAYKRVRDDYRDIHSGKFDNSPGQWVTLPNREAVDPNRNNTCSTGLHFCSADYLPHFGAGGGNRVVIVEIDPSDIVSIPNDYNNTKGRCWRYRVVGEIPAKQAHDMIWPPVVSFEVDVEKATDEAPKAALEPVTDAPVRQADDGSKVVRFFQRFRRR